ncbi:MAG: ribonuclease HI family protein [Patescibacteria group bacterium]
MSQHLFKLFTDGGSRGNPGPAAIGCVLTRDDATLETFKKYIGIATNNSAEYQALIAGLELARKNKVKQLSCYLDSELVVRQLNFQYKVKDASLAEFFMTLHSLRQFFTKITFTSIPREQNTAADFLVNKALDEAPK